MAISCLKRSSNDKCFIFGHAYEKSGAMRRVALARFLFLFSWLFLPVWAAVMAQPVPTERKMSLSFSGFVKNDFITDTRRNAEAVDGLYTLWPLKPEWDAEGKDLHAVPSARMFNISTRFSARLSGWEMGKVRAGAFVEVDFTGEMPPTASGSGMLTPVSTGRRALFCSGAPGIPRLSRRSSPG